MKRPSVLVLAVLMASSAFAAERDTGQGRTDAKPQRTSKVETRENIAEELEEMKASELQMRALLQQQQQQINDLRVQLAQRDQAVGQAQQQASPAETAANDAANKAENATSAANQSSEAVTSLQSDVIALKTKTTATSVSIQEDQKNLNEARGEVRTLSRLKYSGDIRLRFEPFFGGGPINAPATTNRYRERYRLRFNVNAKINDDFSTGFSLASGDLGDPVSTNTTETGFYTRKPIAIDKVFGVYTPHYFKPLTITAGKFGYTWLRTELTWDNDLNPEGASEAVGWDWKGTGINHFAVVGYETPVFEVGGAVDTYMTGAQVQTGWSVLPRVKLTADAAYYDFANADTIAQNQGQTPSNGLATQGITNSGGGNFGFSASSLSNNFGVINGKRVFASKYGILDAIARLDLDTGNKRWPVYALIDFAQNTRACENIAAFVAAGVAAPSCDAHQRHGYWTELKAGQTKNPGDVLIGYTFARVERDAVLSAFNFSDLRLPTNVAEHRIEVYYQVYPRIQVGGTALIGRQLVTAQSLTPERWLKRFQFDTIFAF